MKPKVGRYYKVAFWRRSSWVEQPGVAKCLPPHRCWVVWNYKARIKYVPTLIYKGAFLSIHDCTIIREVEK